MHNISSHLTVSSSTIRYIANSHFQHYHVSDTDSSSPIRCFLTARQSVPALLSVPKNEEGCGNLI